MCLLLSSCFLDPCAGPYIVYMLQEIDILEDWTAIKKVCPVLPVSPSCYAARVRAHTHTRASSGI